MTNLNEATSTDLKVINTLEKKYGWKAGDTLLYRPRYFLTPEQKKDFPDAHFIEPDIVLTDLNGDILAVFENKLEDEKKALSKLRLLYSRILKPRFLYACSPERVLFCDTAWKGLEAGEFRRVNGFMTLEEIKLKIEQEKNKNLQREIKIDTTIAGGYDPDAGKERYYQIECIQTLLERYKAGKQKMLVHMATGLGKTRTMVAFAKALLEYGYAKRVLFVVDRILLARQARDDGFSLISKEFPSEYVTSSNFRRYGNLNVHIVVIDTLENIFKDIPSTFYDLLIVDECHRSVTINRKLIFDHFLCPRIGLTATPRAAVAAKGKNISEEDLAILDTYKLFGCETGDPDYQFDLVRGIDEEFLAPYSVLEIKSHLTREAEEQGIEFDYVLDPDERKKIELDEKKKVTLEQLNKKYLSEEQAMRIAEEIKKNTEYGEKMILFGASQTHCLTLARAINKVFGDAGSGDGEPGYAEAIISDNHSLNGVLKAWFKKPNRNPYIAVSVDIMSTGVDIKCVRYIGFAVLTKSAGKYIQMLGRGTRLDTKTGKFSFKILDFYGLCKRMEDNGKGTPKPNIKVVTGKTGTTKTIYGGDTGVGGGITSDPPPDRWTDGEPPPSKYFLIENPDPAHLIERVWIHGDTVKVIDNIPIEEARKLFEKEVQETGEPNVAKIKKKVTKDAGYEPTEKEIEKIKEWTQNPEIYLDEGQLQKIYDYPQGSIWDFFLHAAQVKPIPTVEERIESAFESYVQTYNFTDEQIRTLEHIKKIFAANVAEKKKFTADDLFSNPVYEQIIGKPEDLHKVFEGKFSQVLSDLQQVICV